MDYKKEERKKVPHPREKANIFSIISFMWTFDLFSKGYKCDLEINDLYDTLQTHSSSSLGYLLEKAWHLEMEVAYHSRRKPSLLRVLVKVFGSQYLFYGIILAINDIAFCCGLPICFQELIGFFSVDKKESNSHQYYATLNASGIIFFSLVYCFTRHWYIERVTQTGIKIRVAFSSLLYKKALHLGNSAFHRTTIGQIVNILSNDSSRFDKNLVFLNHLWLSPLGTLIITYFLWQEIGFSAIVGVAVLLLFIPLHGWLGKKTSQFRLESSELTDRRVKLMNEIISGIQAIKMYAWETPFTLLITKLREEEMQKVKLTSYIRQIAASFLTFHSRVAFFCSVFSFVVTGNVISASKIFITATYFNMLRESMTSYFPLGILHTAELSVSLQRLQSFLSLEYYDSVEHSNLDEKTQPISKNKIIFEFSNSKISSELEPLNASTGTNSIHRFASQQNDDFAIKMKNISAKWTKTSAVNSLNNVCIDIRKNNLSAIIGPVGAGKSSLLLVILKELIPIDGTIEISGNISYSSQEPWLFSSSIRQNILFGEPMDEKRYEQVTEVCALKKDFEQLPFGDDTIIGERGITLSVGQKARVNLARSIYKKVDIYLLDDPLAAVDARVGKHIFEKCIKGFLKNKTCILVTHQLQYLSNADNIMFMNHGSVIQVASHEELKETIYKLSKKNYEFGDSLPENSFPSVSETECEVSMPAQNANIKKQGNAISDDVKKTEELTVKGTVKLNVYVTYLKNGGKPFFVSLVVCLCVFVQFVATSSDAWITYWVNLEDWNSHCMRNITYANESCTHQRNSAFYISRDWCVYIFTILTFGIVVVASFRTYTFVKLCVNASMRLHYAMFEGIIRASSYFFTFNSSGRILNRFSKDMASIDEIVPTNLINFIQSILPLVSIVVVIAVVKPYLLIATFLIGIVLIKLYNFYLATSRDIKRIESVVRSPVYSHFNASLQGLTTIRVLNAQNILQKEFHNYLDVYSSASYLFLATGRAFGLWCDLLCILFIAAVAFSLIFLRTDVSEGNVGLALTQALSLTGMFQWCLRQMAELENQLTAVERVQEYSELLPEGPLESSDDKKPPLSWPNKGEIIFQDIYLRYEVGGLYKLKNLNLSIKASEKVGIVGRTGAGKSSLIAALFRLAEIEGRIEIDGLDISTIGLHDFRSKISVIMQEPILFSGIMRTNLDPFEEYSDNVLWKALEEVQLTNLFRNLPLGLNSEVSDGGSNFSVGQRQLICLARAIVKQNKILVLDEATANVDSQTDLLIQTVIRKKFENCTVLTIAHRLNTVIDSDRILVMDSGNCVELDHPFVLLQNERSLFTQMVLNTGPSMAESLRRIAHQKYLHMSNSASVIDNSRLRSTK